MANPDDDTRQDGGAPDGPPRRQPATIDVKAVEIPLNGPGAAASPDAGPADTMPPPKRILLPLSSTRFAVIGSICVIAAIVAGALWLFVAPDGVDGPQRDAATQEATKPDDVAERIAKLEAAIKAMPVRAPPDAAPVNRVAALEAKLTPLADRLAGLERRVTDNATATRNAAERADAAAGLFDELKKSVADRNSPQLRERSILEGFADRLNTLEAREAALRRKQEESERAAPAPAVAAPDEAVRVAMVALALRSAIERDEPFTAELAAARSLGLDEKVLAALEPFAATGVPTRDELFRGLAALLPELLRVSVPAGHDGSYLDRLQASAAKMMNIRPVGEQPGDDAATVIGRVESKMMQRDIAGAVAELDKLAAPAKELAQPWRAKALARQGAVENTRLIAFASLARLGEPVVRESSPQ